MFADKQKKEKSKRRMVVVAAGVIAVGIGILTHVKTGVIPGFFWFDGIDKIAHVVISAMFVSLLWMAFALKCIRDRIVWVVAVAAGFSALNEITQPMFGRSCDLVDWLADMSGTFIGVLVCLGVGRLIGERGSS